MLAVLDRWDAVEGPALVERLRARFATSPDAQIVVKVFQNGPPVDAPIQGQAAAVPISTCCGRSRSRPRRSCVASPARATSENPIAVDRTRLDLGVDPDKAALLGVPPGAVRRTVRLALSGEAAGRLPGCRGRQLQRRRPPAVGRASAGFGARANLHPLDQWRRGATTRDRASAPFQFAVAHRSRAPIAASQPVVRKSSPVSTRRRSTMRSLLHWRNCRCRRAIASSSVGEADQSARSFGGLGPVIAFTVFGILAVLVVEFGRFREVAVVAGVIPLGMVGRASSRCT